MMPIIMLPFLVIDDMGDAKRRINEDLADALASLAEDETRRAERHKDLAGRASGDAARKEHAARSAAALDARGRARAEQARQERHAHHRASELVAFGRVLDPAGEPIRGLRVEAWDKDKDYDDFLNADTTGPEGDFLVTFTRRSAGQDEAGPVDLFFAIWDADRKTLRYSGRGEGPGHPMSTRHEYFEIVLGPQPVGDPEPPRVGRKYVRPKRTYVKRKPSGRPKPPTNRDAERAAPEEQPGATKESAPTGDAATEAKREPTSSGTPSQPASGSGGTKPATSKKTRKKAGTEPAAEKPAEGTPPEKDAPAGEPAQPSGGDPAPPQPRDGGANQPGGSGTVRG